MGMDIFRLNGLIHGVVMCLNHAIKDKTSAMNQWHQLVFLGQKNPSDVATTYATIDVESGNDEEIFDKEMVYSYKIMYEKFVETIN